MSEDSDKTEQPSQHKLDEARKNGQVNKNTELVFFAGSLVFVAVFAISFKQTAALLELEFFRFFNIHDFVMTPDSFFLLSQHVFRIALVLLLPLLLLILCSSVAVQIWHSGFVWSTQAIQIDFKKLNPVSGLKKLFSRKMVFDLFKNTFKLILMAVGFWLMFPIFYADLQQIGLSHSAELATSWLGLSVRTVLFLLLLLLPFLLADLLFGHWNFMRQMKMSKREVKDEHKKREGDPQVKSKQKQIQRELLKRTGSLSAVQSSDIIIVNPTHIAIALKFEAHIMPSPKVVSAGKGEFADKIRQQARLHRIPIVQNKTLARLLYKECQIGGYAPTQAFNMLVPLYRWLGELKQGSTV